MLPTSQADLGGMSGDLSNQDVVMTDAADPGPSTAPIQARKPTFFTDE